MSKFTVTTSSGKRVTVDAASPSEALDTAESLEAPAETTASGVGQSVATGVRSTGEGVVGLGGDLPGMAGGATKWAATQADKLPFVDIPPEDAATAGKAVEGAVDTGVQAVSGQYGLGYVLKKALEQAGLLSPEQAEFGTNALPTSQDVHGAVSDVIPQGLDEITSYEPKTAVEEFAKFGGGMLPSILTGGAEIKAAKGGMDLLKVLMTRLGTRVATPAGAMTVSDAGTDKLVTDNIISPETKTAIDTVVGFLSGSAGGKLERGRNAAAAAKTINRDPAAIRLVKEALMADGMDDAQVMQKMDRMGLSVGDPDAPKLVDVGANTRQQAMQTQRGGGEARTTLHDMVNNRANREPEMVKNMREPAFGPEVDRTEVREGFKNRLRAADDYEDAYNQQVQPVDPQALSDWIDTELGSAKDPVMRTHLQDAKKSLFIQDQHGVVSGQFDPSSKGLHSARKALRNKLYDQNGNPRTTLGGEEAKLLQKLYAKMNETMDVANPTVRAVDAEISGIKGEQGAFENSNKVMERGDAQSGSEFQKVWDAMPPEQQAATVKGVSRWIDGQVDMTSTERAKLKSIVGTTWNKQKLETMIGPEKTQRLLEGLDTIDEFRQTRQNVAGGSQTADKLPSEQKTPVMQDVAFNTAVGVGSTGSASAGVSAGAMTAGKNWLRNKLAGNMVPENVRGDIAKLLASDNPEAVLRAAALLRQADKKSSMPQAMLGALVARQSGGPR